MTPKLLRIAYVCEFLLAVVAVFTAWPEIGGQEALDLMHWGWKLGLGLSLCFCIVALTAAWMVEDSLFTLRTARWLVAVVALLVGMGTITYYYSLQVDNSDSDDSSTISFLWSPNGLQYPKVKPIRAT